MCCHLCNSFYQDIDECLERTDNCDQYCDNHVGGFTCRCEENVFELTGGNTCQGGKKHKIGY